MPLSLSHPTPRAHSPTHSPTHPLSRQPHYQIVQKNVRGNSARKEVMGLKKDCLPPTLT